MRARFLTVNFFVQDEDESVRNFDAGGVVMSTFAIIIASVFKGGLVYAVGLVVAVGFWLLGRVVGFSSHPMIQWSLGAIAAVGFAYYLHWASRIPEETGAARDLALQNQLHGTTASALAVSALFATGVILMVFGKSSSHSRASTSGLRKSSR